MRFSQKATYQEEGLLGKGSFAEVHKVRLQGKLYALKRIYNSHLKEPNYYTSIKRQIAIMQKIDHPNIVKLIDIYQTQNSLQMLLQYLPGGNLFDKIKSQDRIPQATAKIYMLDIVKAIKYLHSFPQPILHRDIKPENILLSQDNRVKLCDFGSANMIVPDHVRDSYVGTTQYMAPQMKQCKPHDQSLDLWCIGVLMYQLLTGNVPQQQVVYPDYISRSAEDLMKKILVKQQNKRITINQIQQHVWFVTPQNTPKLSNFLLESAIIETTDKMQERVRQKNKQIRQKYFKRNRTSIDSLKLQQPVLINSSSLMSKAAQQSALQYINQLKNIVSLQEQIRQNDKIIQAQKAYNSFLQQLSVKNQTIIKQKIDSLIKKNEELQNKQLKPQQQCKNILNDLINKLDKLKEHSSYFPSYYRHKILEFMEFNYTQKPVQLTDLPVSQYLPKLKIKMLQLRRNSLIQLKCIKKRRKQMQMIFIQHQEKYQPYYDGNATTDHILFRDHI